MTNEAVERLRLWIRAGAPADIVDAALAAERRATVERCKPYMTHTSDCHLPFWNSCDCGMQDILDAEAQR